VSFHTANNLTQACVLFHVRFIQTFSSESSLILHRSLISLEPTLRNACPQCNEWEQWMISAIYCNISTIMKYGFILSHDEKKQEGYFNSLSTSVKSSNCFFSTLNDHFIIIHQFIHTHIHSLFNSFIHSYIIQFIYSRVHAFPYHTRSSGLMQRRISLQSLLIVRECFL